MLVPISEHYLYFQQMTKKLIWHMQLGSDPVGIMSWDVPKDIYQMRYDIMVYAS